MARSASPWYRASKNTWYVQIDGKQINLKVKGQGSEQQAWKALGLLLAGIGQHTKPEISAKISTTVRDILEAYLFDAETKVKANSIRTLKRFILPFIEKYGQTKISSLTAKQVEAFANRPTWCGTTRNICLTTIRTGLRSGGWNHALNVPQKTSRGREAVITETDAMKIIAEARGDFKDLLRFLWLTGCRPSEAFVLTPKDIDLANGVITLVDHKTASQTGKPRLVYMTPETVELLSPRMAGNLIFIMQNGAGWTLNAAVNRLWRLNAKLGTKATLYGFRHTFATQALSDGIPDAIVAELLGHSGTDMIHKHYSHLSAHSNVMRQAAGKVRGKKDES